MRICCISDTHGHRIDVPDGDVLIHAGDRTNVGTLRQVAAAHAWLASLPHRHKIVIAGNHDFAFEREAAQARALMTGVTYLEDEQVEIEGLRIYGSPWQPRCFDWAFNKDRGADLREVWARIPEDVDILVTYGPPHGILDRVHRGEHVGCEELRCAVQRVRPRLHVFGHIHEAYGEHVEDGVHYVNASTCTLEYVPSNAPVLVELAPRGGPRPPPHQA
ncbi:MAG: metallophosphatase domain-containing protein [Planctomycetota bacterium]